MNAERYVNAPHPAAAIDITEWMAFRGQLFARMTVPPAIDGSPIVAVAFVFSGGAVERLAPRQALEAAWVVPIPAEQATPDIGLGLRCANGSRHFVADPSSLVTARHSFNKPMEIFIDELRRLPVGLVVEVGSRARSGRTYTDLIPDHLDYVGVDIKAGPNVDIVGDAHELSSLVEPGSVDAIFSIASFEHLAMPWRCAVEMNRVLKPGGVCFVLSHQTFPLHDAPWDFFRFSDSGWRSIFNRATGFEIIDVKMGEAAAVAGLAITPITWNMDRADAYLGSSVVCRKIGVPSVDWSVDPATIAISVYPG